MAGEPFVGDRCWERGILFATRVWTLPHPTLTCIGIIRLYRLKSGRRKVGRVGRFGREWEELKHLYDQNTHDEILKESIKYSIKGGFAKVRLELSSS